MNHNMANGDTSPQLFRQSSISLYPLFSYFVDHLNMPIWGPLLNPVEIVHTQPENPFAKLVAEQDIAIIPSFTLESGVEVKNVPVAYTTRGKLSESRDNALVICHALSGSADVADWWGPLLGGPGQAFDVTRFFVVCLNALGSPYGSASPVNYHNGDAQLGHYGPEFPLTTIRDDARYVHLMSVGWEGWTDHIQDPENRS